MSGEISDYIEELEIVAAENARLRALLAEAETLIGNCRDGLLPIGHEALTLRCNGWLTRARQDTEGSNDG